MGTQFLSLPMTARDLALGANPMLNQNGLWNPALLQSNATGSEINFSYGKGMGDLELSALGFTSPKGVLTRGLKFRYAGLSDLELREDKPQTNPLAYFSANGMAMDMTLAFAFGQQHFGITMRWIEMSLYMEKSHGLAMDFGYWRQILQKGKLGFSILNLGKMSPFISENPSLPLRVLGGISWASNFSSFSNAFYTSLEYAHLPKVGIVNIGDEIAWKNLLFQVSGKWAEENQALSAGFGLKQGLLGFQYGVQLSSQNLGLSHLFDFYILLP
ncbi:MAG: hypothetical protein HN913_04545 [Candidatus Marinimicrobia bacterium]|jgi:hypothetical protein|nr:hypothetical protein [Candidatus Neomarinimicrobiota bacterium]MBT3692450.1 hypothetical protein [Candidatus Neomarinimicrobiota bacterium]MBT4178438.1 hypothetical protein [Candidatus Neomarinimicrobiota bacterium]MBT4990293.1 hypothetical protein [Candidatus Neomarinimicrobiota bacterium]MBT5404810.1 hypothetical protein [Candidatus Neomarinimicrobiota bacterium]